MGRHGGRPCRMRGVGDARSPCPTLRLMPSIRKTFLCNSMRAQQRSSTRIIDIKEASICNTGDERARSRWKPMPCYKPHITVSVVATRFAREVQKSRVSINWSGLEPQSMRPTR